MNYILLAFLVVASFAAAFVIARVLRTYFQFRGQRIVSCPETHRAVAVRVAAAKVAAQAAIGEPALTLSECSRWPERELCGQECLSQIAESPEACRVRTIVSHWYAGQSCVFCHKPFSEIRWHDHPPAVMGEDRVTREWKDIPIEGLQETFKTHHPVCWSCHVAENFRRVHPELVVDRPAH